MFYGRPHSARSSFMIYSFDKQKWNRLFCAPPSRSLSLRCRCRGLQTAAAIRRRPFVTGVTLGPRPSIQFNSNRWLIGAYQLSIAKLVQVTRPVSAAFVGRHTPPYAAPVHGSAALRDAIRLLSAPSPRIARPPVQYLVHLLSALIAGVIT